MEATHSKICKVIIGTHLVRIGSQYGLQKLGEICRLLNMTSAPLVDRFSFETTRQFVYANANRRNKTDEPVGAIFFEYTQDKGFTWQSQEEAKQSIANGYFEDYLDINQIILE